MELSSYSLSRNWFDFCFENPELINPSHTAIYFFAIEHCNRLGWKEKFGFPTQMTMDALGIKKHQTYIKYLNDLVEWGFIKMIQKSKNQYSANIISLISAKPKNGKALDKALLGHGAKQGLSNGQSKDSIDKPINNITINNITIEQEFDEFWNIYDLKKGKDSAFKKFKKLTEEEKECIFRTLPDYIKSTPNPEYRKHPTTYLNGKCWNDEIKSKSLNNFGQSENLPNFI